MITGVCLAQIFSADLILTLNYRFSLYLRPSPRSYLVMGLLLIVTNLNLLALLRYCGTEPMLVRFFYCAYPVLPSTAEQSTFAVDCTL